MFKLHDFTHSGSCYKIRLLANILGISYETVPVDFVNKQQKTEEYLALNAFGEIPIFVEGELRLRDSQAILVYLASKYDKSGMWYPNTPEAMGRINQWLSTAGGEITNATGARLVKLLNYPLDLEQLQKGARRIFAIMDKHLADKEWLELGHPTIGDIACFPNTALAGQGGIDLEPFAKVREWIQRVKELPGFIPMPGI
jgi:glutathione S-transferase